MHMISQIKCVFTKISFNRFEFPKGGHQPGTLVFCDFRPRDCAVERWSVGRHAYFTTLEYGQRQACSTLSCRPISFAIALTDIALSDVTLTTVGHFGRRR